MSLTLTIDGKHYVIADHDAAKVVAIAARTEIPSPSSTFELVDGGGHLVVRWVNVTTVVVTEAPSRKVAGHE